MAAEILLRSWREAGVLTDEIMEHSEEEVLQLVREFIDSGRVLQGASLDYRDQIHNAALRFSADESPELAILCYATLFEHTLNHIIHGLCRKRGLPVEVGRQIIRAVNFEGKATWLLQLLEVPPLNPRHRASIIRVAAERNAFVHYKFPRLPDNVSKSDIMRLQPLLDQAEKAARYLMAYDTRVLLGGAKRHLSNVAKKAR
ncbi:MAG TPA: hypothetical protein VHG35_09785 [Gemmatimonadales bacterium]|nr:hypothetical protein [Gemmatimonadales bacterium]